VILGLSGHLVADQAFGGAPSITNYEVFLGIWLLVISCVGLAGGFISALGGVVMVALDALSILFTFAGGVVRCDFLQLCQAEKHDSKNRLLIKARFANRDWQPNLVCTPAPATMLTQTAPIWSTTS